MNATRPRRRWLPGGKRAAKTLEESCRRIHSFATRHPELYSLRAQAVSTLTVLQPLFSILFLCTVLVAFPWALHQSELLRPLYETPWIRGAILGFVYVSLIPLLAMYAAGVIRGLTLRLPGAEGTRLEESQAPRLFRLLAETCRSLDAPPVDEVRLSPARLLEIHHKPFDRMAVLGHAKTVVIAGLPLLEEISPQHLRALVAHEVAHLATHRRRLGGQMLGLRARLEMIRQTAEESALRRGFWGRIPDEMLLAIVDKMQQRLLAETFPAARQHEAEADAIAATIAGRDFALSALLRERIAGHALTRKFQEECMRLAETCSEPPEDLFERRAEAARGAFGESEIHTWLRAELERKDDLSQSHGPLWDRLRMLGCRVESLTDFHDLLAQIRPQDELGETAARYFLGDTTETMRARFFREWAGHQAADWRKRFEVFEALRGTAARWENGPNEDGESVEGLWQTAMAIGNTRSWRAALPVAKRILETCPEHADANLLIGQLRLEDDDASGIEFIERAMKSESRVVPVACTLAARYLEERGQRDASGEYQKRCEQYRKDQQAMTEPRAHVRSTDVFYPAGCTAATSEALRRAVERNHSHVRAAYLLRKQVSAGDERPLYVLGIERRILAYENTDLANRMLLERIMRMPGIPADVLVCVVTRANRAMLARWKSVPDSLLYSRTRDAVAERPAPVSNSVASTAELVRETASPATLPPTSSPAAAK